VLLPEDLRPIFSHPVRKLNLNHATGIVFVEMTKTPDPFSFEELGKVARRSTDTVRKDAERRKTRLPVLVDGRVVEIDPKPGMGDKAAPGEARRIGKKLKLPNAG
jgi:hypothetical protein